jgi:thiamine kinase-like enzyme
MNKSAINELDPAAKKAVIDKFGNNAAVQIIKVFSTGNSGASVCHAKINGNDYVLRVINQGYKLNKKFHTIVDAVIRSETYANKLLGEASIGAKLHNYNISASPDALISEYIDGRSLSVDDLHSKEIFDQFIKLLHQLHELDYDKSRVHHWTLCERTQMHLQQCLESPRISASLKERLKILQEKLCAMPSTSNNEKLIHGDLRLNNIILVDISPPTLKIIDLTDISRGDPMEDIASLADSLSLNEDDSMKLLSKYQPNFDNDTKERFIRAQGLIQLRRGVWLITQIMDKVSTPLDLPKSQALSDMPKAKQPGYESLDSKMQLAAACICEFEKRNDALMVNSKAFSPDMGKL